MLTKFLQNHLIILHKCWAERREFITMAGLCLSGMVYDAVNSIQQSKVIDSTGWGLTFRD